MKPIYCPRIDKRRQPPRGHFLGHLDDAGRFHVYATLAWTKDYVTGLWLYAFKSRAQRLERPFKAEDRGAEPSDSAWVAASTKLEALLADREPGAGAKCEVEGFEFSGHKSNDGSVSPWTSAPPDRLRGCESVRYKIPLIIRCHCRAIVHVGSKPQRT